MTKKTVKAPPDEDEAQSKKFLDLANELEAAGELSPTETGEGFEVLSRKLFPSKRPFRD